MRVPTRKLAEAYLGAKERLVTSGFAPEIDWQDNLCLSRISETDFLREAAWVVLSSGMRESIIRGRFWAISDAFRQWRRATEILEHRFDCECHALEVFGHKRKISAILSIVEEVARNGFVRIKEQIQREGVSFLRTLDFIGPVTCYHLAKNIGLDVVKPDRHLVRVAQATGYLDPADLCHAIAEWTGDKVSVVDLVIWRFATIEPRYRAWFSVDPAICAA